MFIFSLNPGRRFAFPGLFSFGLSALAISLAVMNFPPQIIPKRLGQDFRQVRLGHDDVMLETLFADVAQNVLQVRHFGYSAVAEGVELVVRKFAFAE